MFSILDPLSKIEKLHGTFKSLCESFTMNFAEYSVIFQESESSFNLWDSDQNGLIDALEVFVFFYRLIF